MYSNAPRGDGGGVKSTRMRKPPVLMPTLSESDGWRADRRETERVTVVGNGGVVVLRRLVKGPHSQAAI